MIDDGNLNISSDNRIVYNSFYKNSFYVLDSNLKSIYNGKFILDTFDFNNFNVIEMI